MTREQLIKALEHATFYGTWEDACKAQAALDNLWLADHWLYWVNTRSQNNLTVD